MNKPVKQTSQIAGDKFFQQPYKEHNPADDKIILYGIAPPQLVHEIIHRAKISKEGLTQFICSYERLTAGKCIQATVLLNNSFLHRLVHGFGDRGHMKFFINMLDMAAYCFIAYIQFGGDHFITQSVDQAAQYFLFS